MHSILVDVRGKGLLIGLECPTPEIGWAGSKGLFKRGAATSEDLRHYVAKKLYSVALISLGR